MQADRAARFRAGASIRNTDDLYEMLDELLHDRSDGWWNGFFADRNKGCPFFVAWPDESLVADFESDVIRSGRVLELGCGNGRNAIFMASRACDVDAVDFSATAIEWAKERARAAGQAVRYLHASIFELDPAPATYDVVYDSGLFHHIAPHRRGTYLELVTTALKPGGIFSLICFRPEGGSGMTDLQVYERRTLGGGLGFSEESLREIFASRFSIVNIRRMREMRPSDLAFGKDFLWAVRMVKDGA